MANKAVISYSLYRGEFDYYMTRSQRKDIDSWFPVKLFLTEQIEPKSGGL